MKLIQVLGIVGFSLLAFASSAYPGMQPKVSSASQSTIDKINVLAHGFPLQQVAFADGQGQPHTFEQYHGKIVLVNMWATWCPPCVRELPALQRFAHKFDPSQFVMLPISIDQGGKPQVDAFLADRGITDFSSFYDPQMALDAIFPLDTIPATFILDGQGTLIAFVRSFVDWDDPQAVELIEGFIAKEQQRQASVAALAK
ncbi:TlpA disulfide reductase family protein [Shewanella sp. YIC-542]|uniref:TlpA disulfide reductase family protein n=1 Tax=Shewanella mytili TaxID=3377111 RepID=UPI00398F6871